MGYLDYSMNKKTCAGNIFQIVVTTSAKIDENVLREKLNSFTKAFPILCGRFERDYINLAPYWDFNKRSDATCFTFDVYNANDHEKGQSLFSILERCVNRPFAKETCHLAFYLIHSNSGKSRFTVVCDHKLFDAKGAESFLLLFMQYCDGADLNHITNGISLTEPSGLSEWMEKFKGGQTVNRKFVALSKDPPRAFATNALEPSGRIRFRHTVFDMEETSRIFKNAYKEAGFLMEMPYLLACVMMVMHKLFQSKNILGANYAVPVTIDKRTREKIKEQIFFNYVSFCFMQFPSESSGNRKELIRLIKAQWYKYVQDDFHSAILGATALMRIAPFPLLDKFMSLMSVNSFSFNFSYLGESLVGQTKFLGADIESVFHMPRIPTSPGIGIFMNKFGGKLHVVFSSLEGIVQEEDIVTAEQELISIL